ncbi:MAG: hypothetical protein JWO88_3652 [Frankiales bacterium]|nr:hypothetical protein [Frankiales bacterium]
MSSQADRYLYLRGMIIGVVIAVGGAWLLVGDHGSVRAILEGGGLVLIGSVVAAIFRALWASDRGESE